MSSRLRCSSHCVGAAASAVVASLEVPAELRMSAVPPPLRLQACSSPITSLHAKLLLPLTASIDNIVDHQLVTVEAHVVVVHAVARSWSAGQSS